MRASVLSALLLLALPLAAADAPTPPPGQTSKPKDPAGSFKPSEEISPDQAVALPVDI